MQIKKGVAKEIIEVVGAVKIVHIPYEVEVPVYKRVIKPEYVLIKQEIIYKVPKVLYEEKTYEKPVLKEKEYIVPKYVEKIYEIPKIVFKEVVIEKPVYKERTVEVIKVVEKEEVKIIEKPFEVKVPNLVKEDVHVTNAIVHELHVTDAIIEHKTIEALHPKYFCRKCAKEEIDPVKGENQ